MIKKTLTAILLLLCTSLHAIDDKDKDFQLWLYAIAKKKFNSCLSGTFMISNRRDNNATRSYFTFAQLGLDWSPYPTWTIGPSYRQGYRKRINAKGKTWWKPDSHPFFTITKSWSIDSFEIIDRNQFQYSSLSRHWSYRNRIMVKYSSDFSPFVSNEFFFKRGNRYNQNRFQVGVTKSVCGILSGSIAYMLRSKEINHSWINQHVLVLQVLGDF